MAQRQERLPATIGMDGADERSRPTFGFGTLLSVVEMDLAAIAERNTAVSRHSADSTRAPLTREPFLGAVPGFGGWGATRARSSAALRSALQPWRGETSVIEWSR